MTDIRLARARLVVLALVSLIAAAAGSAYGAGKPSIRAQATVLRAPEIVDRQVGVDTLVPADACPPGASAVDTSAQSCSQTDTTVEPAVAVDPENPGHLVVAYQEGRRFTGGSAALGYAV